MSERMEIEGRARPLCWVCGTRVELVVRFKTRTPRSGGYGYYELPVCRACLAEAFAVLNEAETFPRLDPLNVQQAKVEVGKRLEGGYVPTRIWWDGKWRNVILMRDEEKP